jgi:ornithine carbamoyltransferase
MKNLLSIESLSGTEIADVLRLTAHMKSTRGRHDSKPLDQECWALIF